MPDPEPPQIVSATFNDATLEVIARFDRRLRPANLLAGNWDGKINRGGALWTFTPLGLPVADQKNVVFTAQIIGPAIPPPVNRLRYLKIVTDLFGWTGAPVAAFTTFNLTLI